MLRSQNIGISLAGSNIFILFSVFMTDAYLVTLIQLSENNVNTVMDQNKGLIFQITECTKNASSGAKAPFKVFQSAD
jgi:hypothetical protein